MAHAVVELRDEIARTGEAARNTLRRGERGAPARHHGERLERFEVIERLGPIFEVSVAGVRRGVELDQVAGQQHALLRQPHDGVTFGVATAKLQDLHFELAEPQRHLAGEGERRPCEASGNAFDVTKQARKAADLARLILLAAFDDQVVGVLAGDNLLRLIGARAEHAHGVIVREHDVLDRYVGDFADAADDIRRHRRRGLRVGDQHRIVADDDAGIRIALGGVSVGVLGDAAERDLLLSEIGLAGEFLGLRLSHGVNSLYGEKSAIHRNGDAGR